MTYEQLRKLATARYQLRARESSEQPVPATGDPRDDRRSSVALVRITRKRWPGSVVVAGTGITRLHDRVSRRTQPNRLDLEPAIEIDHGEVSNSAARPQPR
jgi:hypothetical protein